MISTQTQDTRRSQLVFPVQILSTSAETSGLHDGQARSRVHSSACRPLLCIWLSNVCAAGLSEGTIEKCRQDREAC